MAPLYSFTGLDWWTILTQSWDRLAAHDNFRDMDYLIPTISSDFTGLIPRPGPADRTLRWLKDALHRQGALETSTFRQLSWHSFRVFIPDWAYQLGMPRDQRQYLGNWTMESIADIYTREKRKVVQRAWIEVADKLGKLDFKAVPIDLQHQHWQPEILDLASSPIRESPGKPKSASPDHHNFRNKPARGHPPSSQCIQGEPLHRAYEHPLVELGWQGSGLWMATHGIQGAGPPPGRL